MLIKNIFLILMVVLIGGMAIGMTSAFLNETEVMDTVCGDINITGTNCTIWWDNLNLTEFNQTINQINQTNITTLNITIEYGGNYTTIYNNHTTIENKTYVDNYYNYTGNLSDLNLTSPTNYNYTYTQQIINDKIAAVDSKLINYALKTENTTTTIKEIKNIGTGWKWAFGINMFLTVVLIAMMAVIFRQ